VVLRAVFSSLLLVLGLAAGCGGDNGESLSTAEFREQADALCAKSYERVDAVGPPPGSLDELVDYADEWIPLVEESHEEPRKLEPPDELAETWNHALDLNDETLELIRDLRAAAEAGDQDRAEVLVKQIQSKDAEIGRLAREVGLDVCG
jgi:hypothetical protein